MNEPGLNPYGEIEKDMENMKKQHEKSQKELEDKIGTADKDITELKRQIKEWEECCYVGEEEEEEGEKEEEAEEHFETVDKRSRADTMGSMEVHSMCNESVEGRNIKRLRSPRKSDLSSEISRISLSESERFEENERRQLEELDFNEFPEIGLQGGKGLGNRLGGGDARGGGIRWG